VASLCDSLTLQEKLALLWNKKDIMDAVWHFKDHNVRGLLFKRFMLADRDDMCTRLTLPMQDGLIEIEHLVTLDYYPTELFILHRLVGCPWDLTGKVLE